LKCIGKVLRLCTTVVFRLKALVACLGIAVIPGNAPAQQASSKPPVSVVDKGKLYYTPDSNGNRIIDFSFCGYKAGEQAIPFVPAKIVVPLTDEDATATIQAAIDKVSRMPADKNGFRGAVLLQPGNYKVSGSLHLHTSGVVLRGSGQETIITGTGTTRETLVRIAGINNRVEGNAVSIADNYVPVNAQEVQVANARSLKAGDEIIITRAATKEWIELLGTQHFGGGITALGWKPGQQVVQWRRVIKSIQGNKIFFDAPLTTALDKKYGGGTVAAFRWPGRISQCGIENLRLVSTYDTTNEKDEDHRWMAITIDNAADVWVRQVSFYHFAGSAVAVYENASRVTVKDCISRQPVSEIGGQRRNTFFTAGQQTLFLRCYAEYGMHDFGTGFCAAGPNAFVQCESYMPYSFSGGLDSWASGVLFDRVVVDGHAISFKNLGPDMQGAGWNVANGVLWNCSASRIDCYQPPGAQNYSFGSWAHFAGDGYWYESNSSIQPASLYFAQLKERTGFRADSTHILEVTTNATSSPTVAQAAELTRIAYTPATSLVQFIEAAARYRPISTAADGATVIKAVKATAAPVNKAPAFKVKNGWLVRGNQLLTGARLQVPWWNGSAKPYALAKAKPAITRFVPGRTGNGLTDDLQSVADSMLAHGQVAIEHNYGLWYDRRRDDHERVRRIDGEVWPPFYELPFARSGKGIAYDGLSKYDLTKYNHWYWNRLRQFANIADEKGLLLIQHHYFQHNILEAGAHYTDFPWRPANNINNTGFPEPVPYAGDKRIFLADQFYDTAHEVRRELHRQFIRQSLQNFTGNTGVLHFISEEYTGPLHFVQFWLNTIRAWKNESAQPAIIGLSTTKDVQDAILQDPQYAALIDAIDIRYWYYQADGSVYAPAGGQHLAPRQHARLLKPKATSAEQVYRAVREYKQRFPEKAIIYSATGYDKHGWAILMAGGSLPDVPVKDADFFAAVTAMRPVINNNDKQWILMDEQHGYVIYDMEADQVEVDLQQASGKFQPVWIHTASGKMWYEKSAISGGKIVRLQKPEGKQWVLWLRK